MLLNVPRHPYYLLLSWFHLARSESRSNSHSLGGRSLGYLLPRYTVYIPHLRDCFLPRNMSIFPGKPTQEQILGKQFSFIQNLTSVYHVAHFLVGCQPTYFVRQQAVNVVKTELLQNADRCTPGLQAWSKTEECRCT